MLSKIFALALAAALVQSLHGMRPQFPGTFARCRHCRVEIDYAITYRFTNPCGLGDIEIVYPKWNGD